LIVLFHVPVMLTGYRAYVLFFEPDHTYYVADITMTRKVDLKKREKG